MLWEWHRKCSEGPRNLEMPGAWNACQEKLQVVNKSVQERGHVRCNWQSRSGGTVTALWNLHFTTVWPRYQIWSYRNQCLPCWILVLLWSDSSLLEWGTFTLCYCTWRLYNYSAFFLFLQWFMTQCLPWIQKKTGLDKMLKVLGFWGRNYSISSHM